MPTQPIEIKRYETYNKCICVYQNINNKTTLYDQYKS